MLCRYEGYGYLPEVHGHRGDENNRVGNPVWPEGAFNNER